MRNLKKVLALVLALMMAVSLMATVSAGAADTIDGVKDEYNEALQVLVGMGIMKGDAESGELRPTDTITRAEFATMVYRANSGLSDENAEVFADYNSFPDVADYGGGWATGFINYAASLNLVKGDENGFRPGDPVTGHEVLTVMLRMLGVEVSGEGWPLNAVTTANAMGLTAGVSDTLGKPATRQLVAQLMFTTMNHSTEQATTVYEVEDADGETHTFTSAAEAYFFAQGNGSKEGDKMVYPTVNAVSTPTGSIYADVFHGSYAEGVMTANAETNPSLKGKVVVGDKTYAGNAGLDLIGHKVRVWFDEDDAAYAIVDKAVNVVDGIVTRNLAAMGFTTASTPKVSNNYGEFGTGSVAVGSHVIVIANERATRADYVIILSRALGVVTRITNQTQSGKTVTTYTVNNGSTGATYKNDVTTAYDGIAVGDFVYVTNINDGASVKLVAAPVLSGAFNGTVTNSVTGSKTTLGSTGYAATLAFTAKVPELPTMAFETTMPSEINDIGKVYNFVLNDAGAVAAIWAAPGTQAGPRYAYLAGFTQITVPGEPDVFGQTKDETLLAALLYFSDGTNEIVPLDVTTADEGGSGKTNAFVSAEYKDEKETTTGSNAATCKNNMVYAVTETDDGYLLAVPGTVMSASSKVVASSNLVDTTNNVYGNAQSVTFVVGGTFNTDVTKNTLSVSVITGLNGLVGNTLTAASSYYTTTGNTKVYTVGIAPASTAVSTDKEIYFYTGSYTTTQTADGYTTVYTVLKDGVPASVTFTSDKANQEYKVAGLVEIDAATGNIKGLVENTKAGVVSSYYEGTMGVDGEYVVVNDSVVWDLTEGAFVGFDDPTHTITVAVAYAKNADGVNVATDLYVISVDSNDAVMLKDSTNVIKVNNTDDKDSGNTIEITIPKDGKVTFGDLLKLAPAGAKVYLGKTGKTEDMKKGDITADGTDIILIGDTTEKNKDASATTVEFASPGDWALVTVVAEDGIAYMHYTLTVKTA